MRDLLVSTRIRGNSPSPLYSGERGWGEGENGVTA